MPELSDRYVHALATRGWDADPAQVAAVSELEALERRLLTQREPGGVAGLVGSLFGSRQPAAVQGVYLWGGVGRGKTFLVDLFCEHAVVPTSRYHFHHFMQETHAQLFELKNASDPLRVVAAGYAARCRVLCFDELVVDDIADAMILATLFRELLEAGVALVFTSNTPPSGLYPDGLQRARFLPAIELLERHTRVIELDAGIDYRLRELEREPIWLNSRDVAADSQLMVRLAMLTHESRGDAGTISILGRSIPVRLQSPTAAWFAFEALCEGPRGVPDYIAIAERFSLVAVSGIPVFGEGDDDAARRFIALIDEFYDRGVKLLATAAAAPEALYTGSRLAFPFRRTVSRLVEMQSRDYLARAHRARSR